MSYVADRNDIKERWDECWRASEKLSEVLRGAEYNSTFSQRRVILCRYLDAQLRADRYKIWKEINEVMEEEDE